MRLLPAGISLLLLGFAMAGCRPVAPPERHRAPPGAARLPEASHVIETLAGGEGPLALNAYAGSVLLLDFWATWSAPCVDALPTLAAWQKEFGASGFQVIGLAVDRGEPEVLKERVAAMALPYPVGHAGPEVQAAYGGVRALPTRLLVDAEGRIVERYAGAVPEADIHADIMTLLAR